MDNKDVSLSDMQWKRVEELEKFPSPFSSGKKLQEEHLKPRLF